MSAENQCDPELRWVSSVVLVGVLAFMVWTHSCNLKINEQKLRACETIAKTEGISTEAKAQFLRDKCNPS